MTGTGDETNFHFDTFGPPPSPDETPRPALAMHIRLRYAADDTPTSAVWNPATT
jgi:hypothetical protein